jgi:HEAT repeat protein
MRQAVASSLEQIGWQPTDDSSGATYWIIKRQWSKVAALGIHALQPLSEALKDADPQVRQSVVTTIGGIQSPGAVDLLLIALRDSDSEVRAATIHALGNMPPERSLPPLITSLQDASLHEAVVEALEHLGTDIIPALLAALKDSDWKVKQGIADALEQLNWSPGGPLDDEEITALYYVASRQWEASVRLGAPAVLPLSEALTDTSLRQDAAQALGRIGDERAVEPLFQALQNETHPPVQRTIARALGQIGESSVDYMIRALEDHLIETNLAIFTLGMIGSPRAVPPLIEILIDRNLTWPQREAAATALGDIGIPSILPLINTMRGKVEPRYAELISGALGRIGSPAVEPITSALAGKDIDVQAAILALGKIGDERAIEVILGVLRVKQYGAELRKAAIWALSQIGPAAVVPVINALGDRRMDKKAISMALVKMGSPVVEPLLVALNVSYGEVREIIVQILGQIGDARAIPALLNLLKDRNINRVIVNEAIKQIDHSKPDRIKP